MNLMVESISFFLNSMGVFRDRATLISKTNLLLET